MIDPYELLMNNTPGDILMLLYGDMSNKEKTQIHSDM